MTNKSASLQTVSSIRPVLAGMPQPMVTVQTQAQAERSRIIRELENAISLINGRLKGKNTPEEEIRFMRLLVANRKMLNTLRAARS